MDFSLNLKVPGELVRFRSFALSFLKHNTPKRFKNFLTVEYEMARRKITLRGMPYILKIDPSNMCNLRCPMCLTGRRMGNRRYGIMEFSTYRKILDELGIYTYRIMLYGQGEPFMVKNIEDMIGEATDRNIGVSISSNLNILNEEQAERIVSSGLEHLIVSLDGASQESYQKYRVGGTFERVINNIKMISVLKKSMKTRYPIIEWQYLVMRHNENEMEVAKKIAKEIGVNMIRFSPFSFISPPTKEELEEWVPQNDRIRYLDNSGQSINLYGEQTVCSWLYRTVVINWDGRISPCCSYHFTGFPENDFGNVNDQSFREIWNNKIYQFSRKLVSNRKISDDEKVRTGCYSCEMLNLRFLNELRKKAAADPYSKPNKQSRDQG
jgi:radical SAM protein with 4Fe4S-binding SPASM domain